MTSPVTKFKLEAPGGEVDIKAHCKDGRVLDVEMTTLPSYVAASNIQVRKNSYLYYHNPLIKYLLAIHTFKITRQ